MKKLRLDVEDLAVESFATASAANDRATVRAHEAAAGYAVTESCTNCTFDDTLCGLTRACTNAPPFC
ncbi:MAG TPA: hypothetical protein VNP72_07255 [Longimicrobium sp.]|nr:hypothetical protein [Longimicrobium sp.]